MGQSLEKKSISVIIPTYNAERSIIRCLESVLNQTSKNYILEVLVVNDGSLDTTARKVSDFITNHPDFPLRLINKVNGGVSTARNLGMKEAKGSWIALLDSDDEWFANKIEIQVATINQHQEIDFLGANHVSKSLKILGKKITKLYNPSIKELCIKNFPQPSTVIFKRKIFEEIGGFDEKQKYAEDGKYFYKIALKYNYYYLPVQLAIYDEGKRGFGTSGLSGNIKAMQDGVRANMRELRARGDISLPFYLFIKCFNEIKYLRRMMITKWRKR